jgi:hypothetical protein
MQWSILTFGKHKGKTLVQILVKDPDWFFWACKNVPLTGTLKDEADDLYRKATSIRIPDCNGKKMTVMYHPHYRDGSLANITILEKQAEYFFLHDKIVSDRFDMEMPFRLKHYDKFGGKMVVRFLKSHILGIKENEKLTKKICEKFFSNNDNFDI